MARKTSEPTGGVFERYADDWRAVRRRLSYDVTGITLPALADTSPQSYDVTSTAPQQGACE